MAGACCSSMALPGKMHRRLKQSMTKSHEAPITRALYNVHFHQVVSGCQHSCVTVWDIESGSRKFKFTEAHGVAPQTFYELMSV